MLRWGEWGICEPTSDGVVRMGFPKRVRRSQPCSAWEKREQQQGPLQENGRKAGCCVWRKAQGEAGEEGSLDNWFTFDSCKQPAS